MKNKKNLIITIMIFILIVFTTGCANNNEKGNTGNIEIKKTEESKKTEVSEVHIGDVLKTDDYEINLKSLDFKKELEYQVSSNFTRSVSIDNGKQALALSGTFKNLMGEKIDDLYTIKCKVVIDDKYKYEGSFEAWQDLEPLVEAPIVLYAQVPESVVDSYTKAEFIFGFNDSFKADYNSDVEQLDHVFSIVLTK